jgi:putative transposase
MRESERRAKVERTGAVVSVRRQCVLLNAAHSGVYRAKPGISAVELASMRGELYLEKSFWGSHRMTFELDSGCRGIHRNRRQRRMRRMIQETPVPRPGTSKAAPENKIYPYLLAL